MSTLSGRISSEMKAAFLSGDRFRGDVLRDLRAAILNEEVAQQKRESGLGDEGVEKVVSREVKKRKESVALYRENGRDELAEHEEKELAILEEFLPEQMSEDEIQGLVDSVISDMGQPDVSKMGQIIGAVKAKAGNSADGALIAKIVKETLKK